MAWHRSESGLFVPERLAARRGQRGFFAMGPGLFSSALAPSGPLSLTGAYTSGAVGTAYSQYLTINGGMPAYTLTGGTGIAAGFLPPGLSLSISAGNHLLLSGTPSASAIAQFTVSVTSADTQVATASFILCVVRGLLVMYPLSDLSGTAATDASGNGHTGTYGGANQNLGQASLLPSGMGKSVQQTGSANISMGAYVNGVTRPMTIFGWGKSANTAPGGSNGQQIVASSSGGFNFYLGSAGKLTGGIAGVSNNANDTRTMLSNTTYFWTLTVDASGNTYIYVNGTPSSVFTAAFTSANAFSSNVWMGNYPSGSTNNWFNGYLQNIGICNVALTATEVSDLYANS